MNVRSWNCEAVQIVPFCDLNSEPPMYCLVTTTFWTSGRFLVLTVFLPIVAVHISYSSDAGERITIAYSWPGSRNTGDGKRILVGNGSNGSSFSFGACPGTTISLGFNATWVKSWTRNEVGVPNSTVLNSTKTFASGSFLAK